MAQLIPAPPLGPPPPRPVVDLQPVAHRISGAVSQAFAEMGLPVQEVLTLVSLALPRAEISGCPHHAYDSG